jgi:hypothetical protein
VRKDSASRSAFVGSTKRSLQERNYSLEDVEFTPSTVKRAAEKVARITFPKKSTPMKNQVGSARSRGVKTLS